MNDTKKCDNLGLNIDFETVYNDKCRRNDLKEVLLWKMVKV